MRCKLAYETESIPKGKTYTEHGCLHLSAEWCNTELVEARISLLGEGDDQRSQEELEIEQVPVSSFSWTVKGRVCASVASLKLERKAVCSVGSSHREIPLLFLADLGILLFRTSVAPDQFHGNDQRHHGDSPSLRAPGLNHQQICLVFFPYIHALIGDKAHSYR